MVVIGILMVTAVSCTAIREGGYYEEMDSRGSAYYGQPGLYGRDVIVVERDPFTGRYYPVSPYGYYSTPHGYYGTPYYSHRNYNQSNRSHYRNSPVQGPSPQQREQTRVQMDASKSKILGERKH